MLEPLAVSPALVSACGIGWVEFFGPQRRYYQPVADGEPALIVAVVDVVGMPEFGDMVEVSDTVDLAAIGLGSGHVGTRLGIGTALGLREIARSRRTGRTLDLVDSALAWVRNPVGVAYIIDWRTGAFTLADLESVKVRCSPARLANRVAAAFARPLVMPRLQVQSA
jgi:hypothetical protein